MNPYHYWPMSITVLGIYAVAAVGFTFAVVRWAVERWRGR